MKKNNHMIRYIFRKCQMRLSGLAAGVACMLSLLTVGCYDDGVHGDSYYVFEGKTIGDVLDATNDFSEFNYILQRAGMKGLMNTYGAYTCLVPTNEAVDNYIATYYPGCTLEQLPDSAIEAVAKSHLINQKYLTSDFTTGYLQTPNMYDRKVQVTIEKEFDEALGDSMTVYLFNATSKIIAANDTVSNGVLHTIDRVLEQSSYVLPDYMASKSEELGFTLFMAALKETHLTDSLLKEKDESPEMAQKLAQYAAQYTGTGQKVVTARKYGYTALVEKDEVYAQVADPANPGKMIYTGNEEADIKSLFNYAKSVYDKVYPEDAGLYDNDYTHPKNPLNRFIAYHLLSRNASYGDLVVSTPDWSVNEGGDFHEYYETLCANTLLRLQKVSTEGDAIRLNRCERSNNLMQGVKVLPSGGSSTVNGNFQFIDNILTYNDKVVNMLKTERIRIDTGSLLEELTNNSVRLDPDGEMLGWYFPSGYFKNVTYDDNCECYYNRWPQGKSAGNGQYKDLAAHQCDNMNFGGEYDVLLRMPAVPEGQYEIRIGYVCNGFMSISQIYFGYDRNLMTPVDIPLDMNMVGLDPKVGMIQDVNLFDDINYDVSGNVDGKITLTENDKAMRNLGYMKGPDAMYRVENDRITKKAKITNDWWYLRRIVTTQQLDNKPFYLRFRKVDERTGRLLNIDFIEICPRSVYNGAEPEDRH